VNVRFDGAEIAIAECIDLSLAEYLTLVASVQAAVE